MDFDAGERITEAGAYDAISLEDYHGREICDGPSLSSTSIKLINDCPLRYWHASHFNPERPVVDKPHFRFGAAIHEALTHDVQFWSKIKTWPNWRTNKAKEERDEWQAAGNWAFRDDELVAIKGMLAALRNDRLSREAFSGEGYVEQTIAWRHPDTGIWLRTRPDWRPQKMLFVPDYKTATSSRPDQFVRQLINLGYHIQAALIQDGCKAVFDVEPRIMFVAQEKVEPYIPAVIECPPDAIRIGRMLVAKACRRLQECVEKQHFPGYTDKKVAQVKTPGWVEYQLADDDEINPADAGPHDYQEHDL